MILLEILFAIAALVTATFGAPVAQTVTLPLTHVFQVSDPKSLVTQAQQRLAAINKGKGNNFAAQANGPAQNDDVTYVAPVTIGGKTWNLTIDTGSSITWCGAHTPCEPTSNGRSTGGNVNVNYGSGSFSGVEFTDKVVYGGLSVARQSLGAASTATGFNFADGIFGLGPVGLTYGTVDNVYIVPTFMNNLYTEGAVVNEVLGVYFKPENGSSTSDNNGALTLGGVDTTKYTGTLTYFPILSDDSVASNYWGISVASFKYGNTVLAGTTAAIVDTGTTLLIIPGNAYSAFLSVTGGATDSQSGLVVFTKKPASNFVITFGSTAYTLTPAQYLVPAAQYVPWGLNSTKFYAWIGNGGTNDVSCLVGQKFLEYYYSVYDTTNGRIGFATRT